jgi:hypothetical protein
MKTIIILISFFIFSCKTSQKMSTKKSDVNITNNDSQTKSIKIKKEKHLNKKHSSYKYYTKIQIPSDNIIKNKRDLKKANQSKKYKNSQQRYLDELNKSNTPDKKKIFDGKFRFYL